MAIKYEMLTLNYRISVITLFKNIIISLLLFSDHYLIRCLLKEKVKCETVMFRLQYEFKLVNILANIFHSNSNYW